jgi:elongation factor P
MATLTTKHNQSFNTSANYQYNSCLLISLIEEVKILPKASELKQGSVVEIDAEPYMVKTIEVRNPTSRGATTLYKIRFSHMKTRQKLDETFKGDDFLKEADCAKVKALYSYQDGDQYIFMNIETYEQYALNSKDIQDQLKFLTDGMEGILVLLLDNSAIAIELPSTVTLQIVETPPAMKSASATNRTKTAKLNTGLEIQVPEYIESGEIIKVNTETGKFMSRA